MSRRLSLGGLHVAGHVKLPRAAGVLVGGEAQLIDLHLQVLTLLGAVAEQAGRAPGRRRGPSLEMTDVTSRL